MGPTIGSTKPNFRLLGGLDNCSAKHQVCRCYKIVSNGVRVYLCQSWFVLIDVLL